MIQTISILAGRDKDGNHEAVDRLDISEGQIYSIVGFTGSGKSQLISDIEQLAQKDTITGRTILINNETPDPAIRFDPESKMVAQLSQNMNFALEMSVMEFLALHAECRGYPGGGSSLQKVLDAANTLAGEELKPSDTLTRLSGGQSRALMIADVAHISNSPIILIDEVENAGIDRRRALDLLTGQGKIVLIVTHDPQLALLGERRVVMKHGGMNRVLKRTEGEVLVEEALGEYTAVIAAAQESLRSGEHVDPSLFVEKQKETA